MALRRLLLVGEGNFSFAAALSETLDPSTSITATCLQRPADLAQDPVAQEHLQRLRERGSAAVPRVRPRPHESPAPLRPPRGRPHEKPRPAVRRAPSGKRGHCGFKQHGWGLLLNVPQAFTESPLCASTWAVLHGSG